MRFHVPFAVILAVSLVFSALAFAQSTLERTRIGDSSVSLIEPESLRAAPDSMEGLSFPRSFTVLEEPRSFLKIWTPRFTDENMARDFAEQSGSTFKEMLELEIDGQIVPMVITYVDALHRSGHIYKALFDAENSIVVKATVFDDVAINRDEVLDAFKTIQIDVQTPIGDFDDAPFTVDLSAPFEFVFASHDGLFIKSYPEIDSTFTKPSVIVGYQDIFIYDGEPKIDSLKSAARYIFPVEEENFFQTDQPDYSHAEIVSEGYLEVEPGQAYRMEARYKDRMVIQYVWDIRGKSEFEGYLFLSAKGDSEFLQPLVDNIATMAASLIVKDGPEQVQDSAP